MTTENENTEKATSGDSFQGASTLAASPGEKEGEGLDSRTPLLISTFNDFRKNYYVIVGLLKEGANQGAFSPKEIDLLDLSNASDLVKHEIDQLWHFCLTGVA